MGFVQFEDGSTAFVDTFGEHDDSGAVLMYRTRKGEIRYINQDKYLDEPKYDSKGRIYYPPKRIHRRMNVIGGSVVCSKCRNAAIDRVNPHYMD
jgi:hypothetical protein